MAPGGPVASHGSGVDLTAADGLGIAPRSRREATLPLVSGILHERAIEHAAHVTTSGIEVAVHETVRDDLVEALRLLEERLPGLQVRPGRLNASLARLGGGDIDLASFAGATWIDVGYPLRVRRYRVANEGYVRLVLVSWDADAQRLLSLHTTGERTDWTGMLAPAAGAGNARRIRVCPPAVPPARGDLGPIDVVYTWVDHRDPAWEAERSRYASLVDDQLPSGDGPDRYADREELRFSLRALELFAPFVRRIHIVTAGQVPTWLDTSDPRINMVTHEDIFPDPSVLPVFNSHAIEACLHRIPGLADRYVYFNDDVLLGREVAEADLFSLTGSPKVRFGFSPIYDGEPHAEAIPTDWAAYHAVRLIERDFGIRMPRKLKHAPSPQRLDVLEDIEERYPEELARTRASRFRSRHDLAVPSMFAPFYGLATGRAVEVPHVANEYVYADTGRADWDERADRIRAKRPHFYCVNSTRFDDIPMDAQADNLGRLFEDVLPFPSSFEQA